MMPHQIALMSDALATARAALAAMGARLVSGKWSEPCNECEATGAVQGYDAADNLIDNDCPFCDGSKWTPIPLPPPQGGGVK